MDTIFFGWQCSINDSAPSLNLPPLLRVIAYNGSMSRLVLLGFPIGILTTGVDNSHSPV
jgi:hypothetical protein